MQMPLWKQILIWALCALVAMGVATACVDPSFARPLNLVNILKNNSAAGIVATQRGRGGGLRLARPAAAIRLGEVVRRLEARQAMVECFRADGGSCNLTPRCRLKGQLALAEQAFYATLDRATLADCALPGPPATGGTAALPAGG